MYGLTCINLLLLSLIKVLQIPVRLVTGVNITATSLLIILLTVVLLRIPLIYKSYNLLILWLKFYQNEFVNYVIKQTASPVNNPHPLELPEKNFRITGHKSKEEKKLEDLL